MTDKEQAEIEKIEDIIDKWRMGMQNDHTLATEIYDAGYRLPIELKLLGTNPYYLQDTEGGFYNKYPEFQVYEDGKQAQLEADRGPNKEVIHE